LVCSGPVTRQIEDRLIRIYEQMPRPKFVVAVGTCACSGGVFKGCYNIKGGIDSTIPVSAYIPGCPASPKAIIDGIVKLLVSLEKSEGEKNAG
jgi:Ni,Fe-hydrogenase III small subunit